VKARSAHYHQTHSQEDSAPVDIDLLFLQINTKSTDSSFSVYCKIAFPT